MANIVVPNNQAIAYYSPPRKLKNSVASTAADGNGANFPVETANIPDKFATTEQPKLKFLFSVQFFPRNDLVLPDTGATNMDDLIFALKHATRPNISMTYQPMNFYNYRTQVLTKIDYGSTPATLTFYDDTSNRALNIIVNYLTTVSPIFNKAYNQSDTLGDEDSATVGSIANALGPLSSIRVAHHSIDPNNPNNIQTIYYDYLNPKIITVNLDDLDMTTSDVTNVEFSFVYDSVNIVTPISNVSGVVTVGQDQRFDINGNSIGTR